VGPARAADGNADLFLFLSVAVEQFVGKFLQLPIVQFRFFEFDFVPFANEHIDTFAEQQFALNFVSFVSQSRRLRHHRSRVEQQ
jgi:hypothetical protein